MQSLNRSLKGLFAICLFAFLQNATAAPLNLVSAYPDFQLSSSTTASFDSTIGQLTLTGAATAVSFNNVDNPDPVFASTFSLTANFSTIDGSFLSGSFYIDGDVREFGNLTNVLYSSGDDPDGWLLQGTLDDFGWAQIGGQDNQATFEFTFNSADGIFGDLFGSNGGMILSIDSGTDFTGVNTLANNFYQQDWSGTLTSGDVWVPVPAAVWLFASGLLSLAGVARRRKIA